MTFGFSDSTNIYFILDLSGDSLIHCLVYETFFKKKKRGKKVKSVNIPEPNSKLLVLSNPVQNSKSGYIISALLGFIS